jgi:ribosome biogenesis GTPase
MTIDPKKLADYGWSNTFQSQLEIDELETVRPVRVTAVHRSGLDVAGPDFEARGLRWSPDDGDETAYATVGDWLLLDPETGLPVRLLERKSLIRRKGAGSSRRQQLLAANVDTMFIVTSCNHDFNRARLERYLALAREAAVTPVIVLTKADLTDDAGTLAADAGRLLAGLVVEAVDSRDRESVAALRPWCGVGQTIALLGSSGVGKTTLINTLTGSGDLATATVRTDDSKGRHTTTGRSMYRLGDGGWVIDSPGIRELQLVEAEEGLEEVFAEIMTLSEGCRFSDCSHGSEPGCAVLAAIEAGDLDPARLERYRKLGLEQERTAESAYDRRARGRRFGKMIKTTVEGKKSRRDS